MWNITTAPESHSARLASSSPALRARHRLVHRCSLPSCAKLASYSLALLPSACSSGQPSKRAIRCGPAAASAAVAGDPHTSSSAGPDEHSTTAAQASKDFKWTQNWWPLMPVAYLDSSKPNAVMILGINMVVWRSEHQWHVWKDQCPHRLAPLSEGRLESDGTIQCAYHGWRFCGEGSCTRIPQALDSAAETTACNSKRSRATVFPSKVKAGMVWVFPDSSPGAAERAAATPLLLTSRNRLGFEQAAKAGVKLPATTWFMRDMPYSYEILLENIVDPAHLPFSHHGVGILKRSDGRAMSMKPADWSSSRVAPNPSSANGSSGTSSAPAAPAAVSSAQQKVDAALSAATLNPSLVDDSWPPLLEMDFDGNISRDGRISMTAPGLVTYTYKLPTGVSITINLYAVPVAPGRSRFFSIDTSAIALRPPTTSVMPLVAMIKNPRMLVMMMMRKLDPGGHLATMQILDGDSVFLRMQDRMLTTEHKGDWRRAYYLPTQADLMVCGVRRWMDEVAGGGPFDDTTRKTLAASEDGASSATSSSNGASRLLAQAPKGPEERRECLDRYNQHTRHCPTCRARHAKLAAAITALQGVRTLLLAALGAAVGAAAVAAATAAAPSAAGAVAAPAVAGVLATVLAVLPGSLAAALASPASGVALGVAVAYFLAGKLSGALEHIKSFYEFRDYVHAHKH